MANAMTRMNYAATVRILLPDDIESENDAADCLSGLLTEGGIYENAIKDWSYLSEGNVYRHAELVAIPVDYDRDKDLVPGAHKVPDAPNDTLVALVKAESFISGFEDDETQEGVSDILAGLRAAIALEQAAPVMLEALKKMASRTKDGETIPGTDCSLAMNPGLAREVANAAIDEARAVIAAMEG